MRKYRDNDKVVYKNTDNQYHNPHGPSRKYDTGFWVYLLNNKKQNIVGPTESIKHMTRPDGYGDYYFINNNRIR